MSYDSLDPRIRCCSNSTISGSVSDSTSQVKVYQFLMFCVPVFFTFLLLFFFYLFYLRPRRVNWSSLRMRAPSSSHDPNFDHISMLESGLKKELREMLPIIVYKESFSVRDTQCSVCLGDYEAEDRLQQIPACGHTFHIDCIDHWLATHTTCPLCRLSLLSSAKSPTELCNIQVGNSQVPSVAENDGEASLQQNSQPCGQFAELGARDTRVLHDNAEENVGRSHCVDCEREQSEINGPATNA